MELDEVEGVYAEVLAGVLGGFGDLVVAGVPLITAAAHLGGDGDGFGARFYNFADDLFGAAKTIDICRVDEVHASIKGGIEGFVSLFFGDFTPVGADRPGAEADL